MAKPPVKRDKQGRFVPAKRKPGAGRKKSTPMRQHLANMPESRRSEAPPPGAMTEPLAIAAPADLGEYGRFLWELLVRQDADCAEKGIVPSVGSASHALAHAYCSAFDRWAEVKETIKSIEEKLPKNRRHLAKWVIDDNTDQWYIHGVWKEEQKFRKEAVAAARALGIGSQHPTMAIQVNLNGQQMSADPITKHIGPYRESAQIIDATAEKVK